MKKENAKQTQAENILWAGIMNLTDMGHLCYFLDGGWILFLLHSHALGIWAYI